MPVQAAQVRTTIDAAPATVWKALTSAEKFKTFFFGSDIASDWKVGNPITFRGNWKGKPYEDKGVIQSFDASKRLAFTHWSPLSGIPDRPENYHVVSFDLKPAGTGTEVVLTQMNLNADEPLTEKNREEYTKNWNMVLAGLKKAVEG